MVSTLGWPNVNSHFGILDLAGFPKDVYHYYHTWWNNRSPRMHLFPHWNWQPGDNVDVWVFVNSVDIVELFVNGASRVSTWQRATNQKCQCCIC